MKTHIKVHGPPELVNFLYAVLRECDTNPEIIGNVIYIYNPFVVSGNVVEKSSEWMDEIIIMKNAK